MNELMFEYLLNWRMLGRFLYSYFHFMAFSKLLEQCFKIFLLYFLYAINVDATTLSDCSHVEKVLSGWEL